MQFDDALSTYVAESRELLQEMEDALLQIEHETDRDELLNAIFRAAHTIKGSAGLFGLDDIVSFTHGAESLLDRLRGGELVVTEDMIALLLSCRDHISTLIDQVEQGGGPLEASVRERGEELSTRLKKAGSVAESPVDIGAQPRTSQKETEIERIIDASHACTDNWHISLRFGSDSLRNGMDPLSFLRYLGTIGSIVSISPVDDQLPEPDEMDAESCYLGFEINFKSDADKETIDSAFDFIREDSLIRIIAPHSSIGNYIELIQNLPEEDMYLGEMLIRCGSLTRSELEQALNQQQSLEENEISQYIGSILVESQVITQPVVDAAVQKQAQAREGKVREAQSVRVDADKLDHLINLIGELVIAGAGTSIHAQALGDNSLIESVSTLTRLVEEVRDSTLRLRMVQIGSTFNRFQRVVRDVSKELGKDIDLIITGGETELDKTVVEKISDPLMHLVRNSMDHGIEPADVRQKAGKSRKGVLRLNAYHDSGSIVIEVSDDGGGLNRDKILRKAIEKGLVSADQQLEDQEIYNLVFEPGFSTADQVSNLSGRGVGMDVVKRNITSLRGTIDIDSKPGQGSCTRIRMPLTLAIIDGFLVGVEQSSFVVPLDMVLECVELSENDRATTADRNYINLRGEVLPFIRLREMFEMGGTPPRRENVIVVNYAGNKAGLVVDRLMGEFQTVIKPLGKIFSRVLCVGGSTILGDGEVALILDVPGLISMATHTEKQTLGSAS